MFAHDLVYARLVRSMAFLRVCLAGPALWARGYATVGAAEQDDDITVLTLTFAAS